MVEFVQVGVHFRDFPLKVREVARLSDEEKAQLTQEWRTAGLIEGGVFVSTCNREEIYLSTTQAAECGDRLVKLLVDRILPHAEDLNRADVSRRIHKRFGTGVARHLFRVAGSLDSMLIGESQILGQVKQAYSAAEANEQLCPSLVRLFAKAIKTAKQIRSETSIGVGALGLDAVALECLSHASIRRDAPVGVVGTGKLGVNVVRSLISRGFTDVTLFNRSGARSDKLAALGEIPLHTMDRFAEKVNDFRAVILVAGADSALLTSEMVHTDREKPLVIVDLGLPANAELTLRDHPAAALYNLDDLKEISANHFRQREEALAHANRIVENGLSHWMRESRKSMVKDVLGDIHFYSKDFRANLPKKLNGELKAFDEEIQPAVLKAMDKILGKMEYEILSEIKRRI